MGPVANVKVRQTFHNPLPDMLEAVYIFPLSPRAAVHQFRLQIGDRVIEGDIQEKQAARQTYELGRKAGHRAALLEQQRDNVFTATIGNVPPGETLTLELCYAERLEMDETDTMFRFPLVIAPRYCPKSVSDVSAISPPLLPPGLRAPGALSIEVEIDHGGVHLSRLTSTQHAFSTAIDKNRALISLARTDEAMNRDFLLRYRVGESASNLLMSDGEYFLLSLTPPAEAPSSIPPRDVVLILDRSGSMRGLKMSSARRAAQDVLAKLRAHDRFALMVFDDRLETFQNGDLRPLSELGAALAWLEKVDARGGTEIMGPMRWLMELSRRHGERFLCAVLVTDGQVGNEAEIYGYLQRQNSTARLFTLGVDSAVNESFLRQVAHIGRGTCELVEPGVPLESALDRLAREIGCPLFTDMEIVDAGLQPSDELPEPLPDMYAARPVTILGRHQGQGELLLRGRRGSQQFSAKLTPQTCVNPALAVLWARQKIQTLQDRLALRDPLISKEVQQEITELALRYRLVSDYTSFVLVDRQETVNQGGQCVTAVQPVERPADWEVECTVKDISAQDFGPLDFEDDSEVELSLDKLRQMVDEGPIVRVANLILRQAVRDRVQEIVIGREPKCGLVHYRRDGETVEVLSPPYHIMAPLVGRFQRMAGLNLGDPGPQSGFFDLLMDGRSWALVVNSQGPNLTLSLSTANARRPLADEQLWERLQKALEAPHGLFHINAPEQPGWDFFALLLKSLSDKRRVAVWSARVRPSIERVDHLLEDSEVQVIGFSDLGPEHWQLVAQRSERQLVLVLHQGDLPLPANLGKLHWDNGWSD